MNRYDRGKIYKITDIGYNKCYIGSTCEKLSKRMERHRKDYCSYLNNTLKTWTTSLELFKEYGKDNLKIELIENYPCESKEELLRREGYFIQNTDCVNRCIAGRTPKEYKEYYNPLNKEKIKEGLKQWYKNNKEHIKEYSERNKEKKQEYQKEYSLKHREDNKEYLKEQKHNYYIHNKDEIIKKGKEIVECSCGSKVQKCIIRKHERTKKHQDFINNQ